VLDNLADADTGVEPKPATRSGDVEGSIRHLSYEDLEAYVAGRLATARLHHCQTHLDSCEACRAELEDLRTLKSQLSGLQRAEPRRRELDRRKRRRGLKLSGAAAIAFAFVTAISAVLWWVHERPRADKPPVAVAVAQPVAAQPVVARPAVAQPVAPSPAAAVQTRDPRPADKIAPRPEDVRPAVSEAIQHGGLQLPAQANTGFALLGPFGEAISETRPEFRWQPLAGAIRYSVTIVDMRLHPVQRSPALRTTAWRPRRPLRRGQTYLWQVTATLHGGSKVVASAPSPPAGLLRIIPHKTRG